MVVLIAFVLRSRDRRYGRTFSPQFVIYGTDSPLKGGGVKGKGKYVNQTLNYIYWGACETKILLLGNGLILPPLYKIRINYAWESNKELS